MKDDSADRAKIREALSVSIDVSNTSEHTASRLVYIFSVRVVEVPDVNVDHAFEIGSTQCQE